MMKEMQREGAAIDEEDVEGTPSPDTGTNKKRFY
jgi:hypothetical protein